MRQPRAYRVENLVDSFVRTQTDQLAIVVRELKDIGDIDATLTEIAVIKPQDRLALLDEAHDIQARAEARFVETINGRLRLGAERSVAIEKKCGDQFFFIAGAVVRRAPRRPNEVVIFDGITDLARQRRRRELGELPAVIAITLVVDETAVFLQPVERHFEMQ